MITSGALRPGVSLLAGLLCLGVAFGAGAADLASMVQTCEACHGKDGASTQPETPTIGGYSAGYIADSLVIYRTDVRHCPPDNPAMCMVAKNMSDDDVKQVSQHFARQKWVRAKQNFDAAKAKRGKALHEANCDRCHEIDPNSRPDFVGIVLAGQWMPYLVYTFKEFVGGKRPEPEAMKHKVEKLSAEDIDALVHFYASFQ